MSPGGWCCTDSSNLSPAMLGSYPTAKEEREWKREKKGDKSYWLLKIIHEIHSSCEWEFPAQQGGARKSNTIPN